MTVEQLDELINDIINDENDRSLIIVSSSIIDEQLFVILDAYLKLPLRINDDDLLKGDSPLSTFSSRIKILYRLGIIENSFRELLEQIRKIRNMCAHEISLNIHRSPIRDHMLSIRRIVIGRPTYNLVLQRYFGENVETRFELKALLITIIITLEAIVHSIVRIEDNDQTTNISQN
jgi:hypothetical protein